jgi:Ca-activated chloride channel family protein
MSWTGTSNLLPAALAAAAALLLAPGDLPAATVTIAAPGSGQAVWGRTTIRAEVATPPGVAVLKVEIFVDGRLLETILDPPYEAAWDAAEGADPHEIRVKAYLGDGTVAAAEARTTPRVGVQRARVLLVEVYASVKDEQGRFVTDLAETDFAILEDGAPQKISLFTSDRKPVNAVLLLDVSASMKREDRLAKAIESALLFVEALEPADRVAVITFSDEAKVLEELTGDRTEVLAAIRSAEPERGTALYDAVHFASRLLGREEGRKALVLLSDGQDLAFDGMGPGSSRSFEEAVREALRNQITAYTIGLGEKLGSDYDFARKHSAVEVLTRIAEETGGRFFEVARPGRLRSAFEKVLEELRFQYTLGYHPANDRRDGGWRAIEVKVKRTRLKVSARKGYFAPTD